jgi:hypothetical protein
MPIYEFYCPDNRKIYSFLARSLSYADKTPRCPDNPKFRMERMISSFAVTGRAKEKPDMPPGGGPDDARMEAAMAEMERDFASMDSENPDPRQIARMMRKMSAVTGEKMPAEAEEMISRMEKGEDPEKLEEEYADVLGDPGDPDAEGLPTPPSEEAGEGLKAAFRAMRRRPVRDPALYEMSDYVK